MSRASSVLLIVALLAAGCHTPLVGSDPEQKLVDRARYDLIRGLDVPRVRGVEGCGAQALAAVIAYHDPTVDAAALADVLPWHDNGATPVDLLLEARDRGFDAAIARGTWETLAAHVQQGEPILVMIDAAIEVRTLATRLPTPRLMHWAVVSGVARNDRRLLLAVPGARHHGLDRDEFLRRWEKSANCMIMVRPGDLAL